MSIEDTKIFPSTQDTTAHQNIITILLDLIAVSWLLLFLVCCSMRSPFFSRRKIMYNFASSVSIFLLFDCQLSFRRFEMRLWSILISPSTVHGYTEMILMNSWDREESQNLTFFTFCWYKTFLAIWNWLTFTWTFNISLSLFQFLVRFIKSRRRFHVNLIWFFFPRKFQFLCLSLSLWKWINEEMKTQRDIQRIKTQSRYRWTKNSDNECHVSSSFRERIENSWRFNVSWLTLWYENKKQFYGSNYCLPNSLADVMCVSVKSQ